MNDMSAVIIPKSDQINADSLLSGPLTITVTNVTIRPGTEQPVTINYEGDNGKPYKPCKSMARVMVHCWGADAAQYAGRSMTLYCDPKVQWGGMAVGGIRISHASHIDRDQIIALTEKKGSRKPFIVKVLRQVAPKSEPAPAPKPVQQPAQQTEPAANKPVPFMDRVVTMLVQCKSLADVDAVENRPLIQKALTEAPQETVHKLNGMFAERRKELEPAGETVDPETGEVSGWAA